MRSLRLLDKSLQLVKVLDDGEADTLLASGKAVFRNSGRRSCLVLVDGRTVRDFQRGSNESNPGGPAIQSTYMETHGGRTISMQKRVGAPVEIEPGCDAAPLHKWDSGLTFEELRAGQLVSQATREKRAFEEHRRKNLLAYLAYEEYQRQQPLAA